MDDKMQLSSRMDKKIAAAEKEVLVEIVKLSMKKGMKGAKGGWNKFLSYHDRKFDASLSDPAKRSVDVLAAFLKTFTTEEDLKFFAKVMRCHSNRKTLQKLINSSHLETPQQRLVRLTLEHPQYSSDYSFRSYNEEWMVITLGKISKALKSNAMVGINCETVLCEDGTEAVVKVCVVDHELKIKLDELVNPKKPVADYRTKITGITAEDLDGVTCCLEDIQRSLKKLLLHGTILVGHSLYNDLQALKLDYPRVIDTSFIFKYLNQSTHQRASLNNLCKSVLGDEVQKKGAPHNCLDDAQAAMKLVLAKLESGFDYAITLASEDVPETELSKLLLHRIPNDVPREELWNIFPEDFIIELEPNLKAHGRYYSMFAIFKDAKEAREAFERVEGDESKDSHGRQQKRIHLKLSTGVTTSIYVRKMGRENPLYQNNTTTTTKKRHAIVEGDSTSNSKKQKTVKEEIMKDPTESNNCVLHVKEIERLKKEVLQRDEEIFSLQRILSAFTRKHGL